MKVTYLVFASSVGTNGATIVITQRSSPSIKKYLDGYLALQREKAMRWPNGCLRRMATLSLDVLQGR